MEEVERQDYLVKVHEVVQQKVRSICGGETADTALREQLARMVDATVSIAKDRTHDIEVRVATAIYKRYRKSSGILEVTSDLGLTRLFLSAQEFGQVLGRAVEEEIRSLDCRCTASGFLLIVTPLHARSLRLEGKLPCPHCAIWLDGAKGVWWHVQQQHKIDHSLATMDADRTKGHDQMIVVYGSNLVDPLGLLSGAATPECANDDNDPFQQAKRGDLAAFQQSVQRGFDAANSVDKRGASVLLWAAGGGHLPMVRYLVEDLVCDPEFRQHGRRAFRNRTALHWACRNGHLPVVQYLVETCNVDVEAEAGDGTTAFCWASWQNHRYVMDYMVRVRCNVSAINSYGCNAALWAAQGRGETDSFRWLEQAGCPLLVVNSNGHGILHKAAQRGRKDICEWFCYMLGERQSTDADLLGPDTEGCVASDLAGMEGHLDVARWLAEKECELVKSWVNCTDFDPSSVRWLRGSMVAQVPAESVFEPYAGVQRIRLACKL